MLGEWEPEGQHGSVAMVDGLIAMGAPDELELAARARQETWLLVHMPAASCHELEERALRAASGVICTSSWASTTPKPATAWRAAALEPRNRLPGWKQTAAHVLDVLGAEVSARIGTRTSTYS